MPMEKVQFQPNTPECVRLKYPVGKIVSGVYGEQIYYTLADGRAMYLDLHVGQKVNELAARPGDPIMIMKKWSGKKTDKPVWHVWRDDGSDPQLVGKLAESMHLARASQLGPQGDGTFAISGASVSAPAPVKAAATNATGNGSPHLTHGTPRKPAQQAEEIPENPELQEEWARALFAEGSVLIDVYAALWRDARAKYPGEVKPDDVRGLLTTAYISSRKLTGGFRAA
jgi:hypothetical protein